MALFSVPKAKTSQTYDIVPKEDDFWCWVHFPSVIFRLLSPSHHQFLFYSVFNQQFFYKLKKMMKIAVIAKDNL